jgi:hypothetical protein
MPDVHALPKEDATVDRIDLAEVERQVREALAARAARLGLDRGSITSPSPGAVVARTNGGDLLRVDVCAYRAVDLDR